MGIMKKTTPGPVRLADRPLADRLRPSALEDIMGRIICWGRRTSGSWRTPAR
ncbi:MAG: hypothetical protein ACLT38_02080 [Akkermansia sp.]